MRRLPRFLVEMIENRLLAAATVKIVAIRVGVDAWNLLLILKSCLTLDGDDALSSFDCDDLNLTLIKKSVHIIFLFVQAKYLRWVNFALAEISSGNFSVENIYMISSPAMTLICDFPFFETQSATIQCMSILAKMCGIF